MATDGVFPSTCWECGTLCGSLITVRDGAVSKIGPNPRHPISKGAFCVKGIRALREWTDHDDRLLTPLRREGERGSGKWQAVSWDDALDEMADRLSDVRRRFGPLALAGAVSGGFFSRGVVVALLMRSLGSPNWLINQDLCGGCRAVSDRLTGLGIDGRDDIDNAKCVLVVGRNPQAADPVQWQALKRARARDAKIVVLDPVRTPAAELADIWLQPKPGTDAAIALAMIHVSIEEGMYDRQLVAEWCYGFDELAARAANYPPAAAARISGVAGADIEAAARLYGAGPSSFVSGHGIDAFSAGVQTFRAFHCLVAISGNLDRVGGNIRLKKPPGFRTYMDLLHDPEFRLDRSVEMQTIGAGRFPLWAGPEGWQTACHNPSVIDAILTGEPYPVRAMYVSGVNIAVTYPGSRRTIEALRSLDFLAVASQTMTPTASIADIVLPKTTTLEEEEVSLHAGGPCVTYTAAVSAPRGEARCDLDIAVALVERLEARGAIEKNFLPWRTQKAFNAFLLGDCGIDIEALRRRGFAEFDTQLGDFEANGFATPSGKIELRSERLAALGLDPLPSWIVPARKAGSGPAAEFPLVLLTGAREKSYHHSRFRDQAWARKVSPDPWLKLHPATAAANALSDGAWLELAVEGGPGRCRLRARITDTVAPGVVSTGMGWWLPEAAGPEFGALSININAAISYDGPYDQAAGSADTRGLRCRLFAVAGPEGTID